MTAVAACAELFIPRKLPPSARDRNIFSAVTLKGERQAVVAKAFDVSQPRVAQIVKQVTEWTNGVIAGRIGPMDSPAEDSGLNNEAPDDPASLTEMSLAPEEKLRLAEEIAYQRYEHIYGVAMRAWRKSTEISEEHRCKQAGSETVTIHITKTQTGQVGLLSQAMRAATASARLLGVDITGKAARQRAESTAEEIPAGENSATREGSASRESSAPAEPLWDAPDTASEQRHEAARSANTATNEAAGATLVSQPSVNPTDASEAVSASTHQRMGRPAPESSLARTTYNPPTDDDPTRFMSDETIKEMEAILDSWADEKLLAAS